MARVNPVERAALAHAVAGRRALRRDEERNREGDPRRGGDGCDTCFLHRELLRWGQGPRDRRIDRAVARLAEDWASARLQDARAAR